MSKQKNVFEKKLGRRKLRLYLIFTVGLIISLIATFFIQLYEFDKKVQPQIARAVIQISKMFPEIEHNDVRLRETYEQTVRLQKLYYEMMELPKDKQSEFMLDEGDYNLSEESLSWIERISRIKVGNDGYVVVVSKEDGKILSHPDSGYMGKRMLMWESNKLLSMDEAQNAASYNMMDIAPDTDPDTLKTEYLWMIPEGISGNEAITDGITVGYSVAYNDTYIIFGLGFKEMFSFMVKGFCVTLIAFIAIWVFIRYVCMLISRHEKTGRAIRSKLIAHITFLLVGLMLTSGFVYILAGTTLTLTTMEQHSKAAVETLEDFKKTSDNINKWADERYLTQCKFIADLMMSEKYSSKDFDRAALKELSEVFGVKYIYRYDKNGKVVMTNSPYDNISLSNDEESQSYIFRKLLNGVDYVIQPPVTDELSGEYLQYIGVSLRDKNDLCDGFVQIAIDPALRKSLTEWLTVETVLENLLIGLPEDAVAIDKETMTITATTGLGYIGDSAETLDLTAEKMSESSSGFLAIRGREYYYGLGETSELYIVPVALSGGIMEMFGNSLKVIIIPMLTLLLIFFAAIWRYQKNVLPERLETKYK